MSNLSYLLLPLIMVIAIIVIMVFYLASLESRTFDWSWTEYLRQGEYMEAPWFYPGAGGPYRIRNEIRRGSEGFKRTLDPMSAGLEKGSSPEEYAEHHRRKERDMR